MNAKLRELPLDERIRLVEDLWDSIAADQKALSLTPAQKTELDRRLEAYELDKRVLGARMNDCSVDDAAQ
jgi:putative addiction module component (TIGR02574 family)